MKKYIGINIVCLLVVFFFTQNADGYSGPEKVSNGIRAHVDNKYELVDQFPVYNAIRARISDRIGNIPKTNIKKLQFYKDLMFFNNNNILDVVRYITSREGAIKRFEIWKNEIVSELDENEKLLRKQDRIRNDITFININNLILENNEILKISFEKAVPIKESEIDTYLQKNGAVFYKEQTGYTFVESYEKEKMIMFDTIAKQGPKKFLLYSDNFFEENGAFYSYKYERYYPINQNYGFFESDIKNAGYSIDNAVFLRLQDGKNHVTFNPEKVRISSTEFFGNLSTEEKEFINTSTNDALRIKKNYDETYKGIYDLGMSLTKNTNTEQEKIKSIYDWINKNVSYPKEYDLEDARIFSGLEAFERKLAVCEGQARLMYYLLKVAGIKNVELIDGYVIDSDDFPKVGHAWIQIGNYFYDPSFEPKYQLDASKYLYYKIPYDIAYTNRYNLRDIPDTLFETSPDQIKLEVEKRRLELTGKYRKNKGYTLLKKPYFQVKYSIEPGKNITIQDIYEHLKKEKLYSKNGKLSQSYNAGETIEYYTIKSIQESINHILEEIDYDISSMTLLKIYDNDVFTGYGLTDSINSVNDIGGVLEEVEREIANNQNREEYKKDLFQGNGEVTVFKTY